KTGWTGRAGGCLIATATREGQHLLVVVMGSPRVFEEAAALLDYGFAGGV
ncbi:MAG: D-alanyl-D-alanine carboxypeptidase, partial [Chloroflexi bacterium]